MTNEELAARMDEMGTRLEAKIDGLGEELRGDIARLDKKIDDVAAGVRALNAEMEELRKAQERRGGTLRTVRLGG